MITKDSRSEHLRQVTEKVQSNAVRSMEKLRLVLLYALRYEHDSSVQQLKFELRKSMGDDQVTLIDCILRYAGSHIRGGDLFSNKSFLAAATNKIQKGFKGVPNVYTQHKSYLLSTVDQLVRGKLRESTYPLTNASRGGSKDKVTDVVVFVVGGCTFEEARDMDEIKGVRILLGGSTVHNSRSFLADIAQLARTD